MGYCLPPAEKLRLSETKGLSAKTFANAVLTASGFVPEYEKQRGQEIETKATHYLARWAQP